MPKGYTGAPNDSIPPTHQHQGYTGAFHHSIQQQLWIQALQHTTVQNVPIHIKHIVFKSSTNGRVFNITLNLSCHSHNIIYLIPCTKCSKQYIGKTKQLIL
ncbi:hypothetical protein ElyMa_003067600 [Elysia marginata]|uniref:Uncharacterized protein n=1 Tax=Elysia marginata TaxID=1093978 RepID=A0AAV4IK90_9GAST|nr:hypothetical protein ElyMa_003067600 [Elysia marginata]